MARVGVYVKRVIVMLKKGLDSALPLGLAPEVAACMS